MPLLVTQEYSFLGVMICSSAGGGENHFRVQVWDQTPDNYILGSIAEIEIFTEKSNFTLLPKKSCKMWEEGGEIEIY